MYETLIIICYSGICSLQIAQLWFMIKAIRLIRQVAIESGFSKKELRDISINVLISIMSAISFSGYYGLVIVNTLINSE